MFSNSFTHLSRLIPTRLTASFVKNRSWLTHRRPSKVVLPFDHNIKTNLKTEKVIDLTSSIQKLKKENSNQKIEEKIPEEKKVKTKISVQYQEKYKNVQSNRQLRLQRRKDLLRQKQVFDENGDILYEKVEDNDVRVSSLILKLKSKKSRKTTQQILVEGWRLIVDGIKAKCKLQYIIFSDTEILKRIQPYLPAVGVQLYKTKYADMKLLSAMATPPGIYGVFEKPTEETIVCEEQKLPIHLICDNIRTPDNLGAILRSAVACGCEKIILTKGCVDLWDPKVVRSAAGAHFKQCIVHSIEWNKLREHLPENTSIFIADNHTNILNDEGGNIRVPVAPYYTVDYKNFQHLTLIVGGETEGISEESYRLAEGYKGLRVNIPLQNNVDSLNTGMAAAIIMFEMKKHITTREGEEVKYENTC